MNNKRRYMSLWSLAATLAVACREDVLADPSFDRWCGETLCAWSTDEGEIARVASWHERDHAVELVGSPVQLSQYSDTTSECLAISMLADVQKKTHTTVAVDFNDDGSIEFERNVPAARWELVRFSIPAPIAYDGLRFIVRKADAGKAVIAQLRAEASEGCTGEPVQLRDLAAGSRCSQDAECASSHCIDETCAECERDEHCGGESPFCVVGHCSACVADADCPEGQRCVWSGAVASEGRECVAEAATFARDTLALCDRDQDCRDGACGIERGDNRLCGSECGDGAECSEGLVCRALLSASWELVSSCARPGEAGSYCQEANQCASGNCCQQLCAERDAACD